MYFPTAYNPPFGTFIGRGGGLAARGGGFVGRGGGLARGGGFVCRGGGFAVRGGSHLPPQFALEDLAGGRARSEPANSTVFGHLKWASRSRDQEMIASGDAS